MPVVPRARDLPGPGSVLAIGNFDGVHAGHRALLARLRELAVETGGPSGVVTFYPPAKALFTGTKVLSTAAEKRLLLAEFAPDAVAMIPFDLDYARTNKDAFLEELRRLSPKAIVVGEDFRFGRDRAGGLDDLQHAAERLEVFALRAVDGRPVKSSRVRERLDAGDVEGARELLGAPYPARGPVVHGDQRGRTLGYPTANVHVEARKMLPQGVFAVRVDTPAGRVDGMANVGARPSYPEGAPSLEVHLFDVEVDLYDREITVWFHRRLRDPARFDGPGALRAQLDADARAAREALAGEAPEGG